VRVKRGCGELLGILCDVGFCGLANRSFAFSVDHFNNELADDEQLALNWSCIVVVSVSSAYCNFGHLSNFRSGCLRPDVVRM